MTRTIDPSSPMAQSMCVCCTVLGSQSPSGCAHFVDNRTPCLVLSCRGGCRVWWRSSSDIIAMQHSQDELCATCWTGWYWQVRSHQWVDRSWRDHWLVSLALTPSFISWSFWHSCSVICRMNKDKRGSSVNFGGQDIFARKCTYEKLMKCAAKTGFEIQSYIPRTREVKNGILSKMKGACSFFFQKCINCRNITWCLLEKYFFPEFGGGRATATVSYAYVNKVTLHWARLVLRWVTIFARLYHFDT